MQQKGRNTVHANFSIMSVVCTFLCALEFVMEEQHFRCSPCEVNSMMATIRLVSVSVWWSQIAVTTILHNNYTSLCVHLSAITIPNKHRHWKSKDLQLTMSTFPLLRDKVQHNSFADMQMVPHIGCSTWQTLLQCEGTTPQCVTELFAPVVEASLILHSYPQIAVTYTAVSPYTLIILTFSNQ